ncbi:MAG: LPS export ABC transporter periplasmic protein LptC [Tatlockia sp.]|nr:LPS export ABC transporter periplasmic protein LptC [Tatlockia sp.]
MNATRQAGWLFCSLFALACSGMYFASSKPVKRLDDTTLSKTADIVVSNLNIRRFDLAGNLINYIETPMMQHIPENNIHLLTSPKLTLAEADKPSWQISAKMAKGINNGERITFIQDVIVHQGKGKKVEESTIKTEVLDYFTKSKIASTEAPVSIEQPGSIVHSKGMKAYLDEKRVFLSKAQATFDPKHAKLTKS